ncbi:hypothetical protein ACFL02_00020 [Planctomycetota bacterium]
MMRRSAVLFLMTTIVLVMCETVRAQNMGTAFTYQGRLSDGGGPAQGEYDFQFKIFNDPNIALGGQIGITVFQNDLPVSNGLFSVNLDFEEKPFKGDARWLEIGVRPGDSSAGYTILEPRQAITMTPYALLSQMSKTLIAADGDPTDAVYVDNDGKVGVGTTTPSKPLHVENEFESAIYGLVTSPVSSGGAGVLGETNGNGYGVMGEGFGASANGVFGVAQGEYGTGVRGIAFSFTGDTKAISADNWSSSGIGVRAEMIASQG